MPPSASLWISRVPQGRSCGRHAAELFVVRGGPRATAGVTRRCAVAGEKLHDTLVSVGAWCRPRAAPPSGARSEAASSREELERPQLHGKALDGPRRIAPAVDPLADEQLAELALQRPQRPSL